LYRRTALTGLLTLSIAPKPVRAAAPDAAPLQIVAGQAVDSDEAARVHRSHAAHRSNLMAPTIPI